MLAIYASEARFIARSHRASEARIRASETRFIARSQDMRAKRDLLLARIERARRDCSFAFGERGSLALEQARQDLLLARNICERSEIYCSLAFGERRIRASETRFIARSQNMRAKRDLLLARIERARRDCSLVFGERDEIFCSLAIYTSEARFFARWHRVGEERLLARSH